MSLEEKLIYLYTCEGFLIYSVNCILREGSMLHSNLHLYFTLLQASIAIAAKKYNPEFSTQAIKTFDQQNYYVLYRGAKISKKILLEDTSNLQNSGSGRFVVYNEFLSTTHKVHVAQSFLKFGELKDDQVRVFYTILIPKSDADRNPNLMCFIEEISAHKSEFEVLLSSSTIFQIKDIKQNQIKEIRDDDKTYTIDHYNVTLMFVSNGFNKYDFIKYSTLKSIHVGNNHIGPEGAKSISDSLKSNSGIKDLQMHNGNIQDLGAKYISEALKINCSLEIICLAGNNIGPEGAKFLSDSLKINSTLKMIDMRYNIIGDKGAKYFSESLKSNITLEKLVLNSNDIGYITEDYLKNLHADRVTI